MNESYVAQDVTLLQHNRVDDWDPEMKRMNKRKSVRPYRYQKSLIRSAEILKTVLRLPFRRLEGFLQALACFIGFPVPDYSTIEEYALDLSAYTFVSLQGAFEEAFNE